MPMNVGDVVYYRDENGAHFGRLRSLGRKWAVIEGGWKRRRVPVADVKPWPPVREAVTTRPVKRGRA